MQDDGVPLHCDRFAVLQQGAVVSLAELQGRSTVRSLLGRLAAKLYGGLCAPGRWLGLMAGSAVAGGPEPAAGRRRRGEALHSDSESEDDRPLCAAARVAWRDGEGTMHSLCRHEPCRERAARTPTTLLEKDTATSGAPQAGIASLCLAHQQQYQAERWAKRCAQDGCARMRQERHGGCLFPGSLPACVTQSRQRGDY